MKRDRGLIVEPTGKHSRDRCLCSYCETTRDGVPDYTPTHRAEMPVTESGAA